MKVDEINLIGICELAAILNNAIDTLKKAHQHRDLDYNEMIKFAFKYDESTQTYNSSITSEFAQDVINIDSLWKIVKN